MTHPEELLAEYVDGSLPNDERAVVDAHLAGCATCRDEVALATRARGALAGLSEVDMPAGVRPDLAGRRVRPARSFRRVGIVTGAAAASIAAIAAIVLAGHGPGGSSTNPKAALGGGGAAASSAPVQAGGKLAIDHRATYTRAQLQALADSIVQRPAPAYAERRTSQSPAGLAGTNSGPAGGHGTEDTLMARDPLSCVQRAGDMPASTRPFENVFTARFEGRPAVIGVFVHAGVAHVLVVSESTCSLLFTAQGHAG